MSAHSALLAVLFVPLATAILVRLLRRSPNLRDLISVAGGIGSFAVVVTRLLPAIAAGDHWRLEIADYTPVDVAFELVDDY